jgi:hypothetical protein
MPPFFAIISKKFAVFRSSRRPVASRGASGSFNAT